MREICLSGSMSGNRKQNQAKPDCGGAAKAKPIIHRETTVTAPVLDSTLYYTHSLTQREGVLSVMTMLRQLRDQLAAHPQCQHEETGQGQLPSAHIGEKRCSQDY